MGENKKTIIACEILRLELEAVIGDDDDIRLHFIDVALHQTPKIMPEHLTCAIKSIEEEGPTDIIMGYGLCSNGVVGLSSTKGLTIARCHDCLGLLLGSPERYLEIFNRYPGTFYMFAGMINSEFDPLTIVEKNYAPRLGMKNALKGMSLALKHYTHIAYIENKVATQPHYRKRFLENCEAFEKEPLEIEADLNYIKRLVYGPHLSSDFINLAGGEQLEAEPFLIDNPNE